MKSSSAYPYWIGRHDIDVDFGLLVLVDQAHQLLGGLGLYQHDRTGQGVRVAQLCVAYLGKRGDRKKYKCGILVVTVIIYMTHL